MSPLEHTNALRATLLSTFRRSLLDLAPARLVRDFLRDHALPQPCSLIAVGKAAPAMAEGSLEVFAISRGLIVTTDGTPCPTWPVGFELVRAAHPVPDTRSLHAADLGLRVAASARDHLLVLVSGGTSSLLCAPVDGLALADKQSITRTLLGNGASIRQINTVRRHLSRIKGGGLVRATAGNVTCLVISDVVDGAVHDVGSGPACADPTTVDDARLIIRSVLPASEAASIESKLVETLSPHDAGAQSARVVSLAGPEALAERMRAHLSRAGFACTTETITETTVHALADALASRAQALAPGSAVVVAAEPTVVLPSSSGSGGRAGWIALRACAHLREGTVLLAAASDGVDGCSGGGGACVGSERAADAREAYVMNALARFDDASVHRRWGTQLDGMPTGINMTDVYVVARA